MVIAALFHHGYMETIQVWMDSRHHKARQTLHNQTDNLLVPQMPYDKIRTCSMSHSDYKRWKQMQPQLKTYHRKMQILLGFSLYPHD